MRVLGVFNPTVGSDNQLFVDPKLLEYAGEEFSGSQKILNKYFSDVITVLKVSKRKHDIPWNAAWKRMQFKETSNTALGFSKDGTSGNGIGKVLAESILQRAEEILPHVAFAPEVFELIGVFAEGVGCDRLSDMLVSILQTQFLEYTERVTKALGVVRIEPILFRGKRYICPKFSRKDKAVILLPRDILRPLPVALDFQQALDNAHINDEVRHELNALFAAAASHGKTPSKSDLRAFIQSRPRIYREIIKGYKEAESEPYNFDRDPENVSDLKAIAQEVVGEPKVDVAGLTEMQRVDAAVTHTVRNLRQGLEHNRLSDCIFDDDGKPRHEVLSQRIFYAVSKIFAGLFNVSITREPNAGSGAVDFHFSIGHDARVLLELKLSSHERLADAYTMQLPTYAEAEGIDKLVLLVIKVGNDSRNLASLDKAISDRPDKRIKVEMIDAVRKPSASKRRG
jgi:hypothetical protein